MEFIFSHPKKKKKYFRFIIEFESTKSTQWEDIYAREKTKNLLINVLKYLSMFHHVSFFECWGEGIFNFAK